MYKVVNTSIFLLTSNCQNIVEIAIKFASAITMINSTRTHRKVAAQIFQLMYSFEFHIIQDSWK